MKMMGFLWWELTQRPAGKADLWEPGFQKLRLCSPVAPQRPSAYSCVNSSPRLKPLVQEASEPPAKIPV